MHYYKPGQKDDMHCYNADQTFYVIVTQLCRLFQSGRAWQIRHSRSSFSGTFRGAGS